MKRGIEERRNEVYTCKPDLGPPSPSEEVGVKGWECGMSHLSWEWAVRAGTAWRRGQETSWWTQGQLQLRAALGEGGGRWDASNVFGLGKQAQPGFGVSRATCQVCLSGRGWWSGRGPCCLSSSQLSMLTVQVSLSTWEGV
jgi:hypothetical protein